MRSLLQILWLRHHDNANGFDDDDDDDDDYRQSSVKKTTMKNYSPRGLVGTSKHIFSKYVKKKSSKKIGDAVVANEPEESFDDVLEGTGISNNMNNKSTSSSPTKRDGSDLIVYRYYSQKRSHKLKHPDSSTNDAQTCSVRKPNNDDSKYSSFIHSQNNFENGNSCESIVRSYKSSKVCFDLTPRYAGGAIDAPLLNARHHNNDTANDKKEEDCECYEPSELWYTSMDFATSRRLAYFLVREKKDVQNYVKCVSRYLQHDQSTESENQHNITTKGMFKGMYQGYRGLEVFGESSSRHARIKKYVQSIVQYSRSSNPTSKKMATTAPIDDDSDDTNYSYSNQIRIYSESLTMSSRAKAWRMGQVDAIAARVVEI